VPRGPPLRQRQRFFPQAPMSAQVKAAMRWSLSDAEREFPTTRDTLARRLNQSGEQPGEDGKFSTHQICAAVFPAKDGERNRLAREQADAVALDNAERRRALIPVEDAKRLAGRYVYAVRQKIIGFNWSDEEKNAVFAELRRLAEEDFTRIPDGTE
jgi:hypothetical protein